MLTDLGVIFFQDLKKFSKIPSRGNLICVLRVWDFQSYKEPQARDYLLTTIILIASNKVLETMNYQALKMVHIAPKNLCSNLVTIIFLHSEVLSN